MASTSISTEITPQENPDDVRFEIQRVELRAERVELEHLHVSAARLVRSNGSKSSWIVGVGDLPPRLMPWLLSAIWTVLLLCTVIA